MDGRETAAHNHKSGQVDMDGFETPSGIGRWRISSRTYRPLIAEALYPLRFTSLPG